MREAIGGTSILQIVIVFILLFTGFMCLSINQSKAFNVKDKIIQTIQSYNGINLSSGASEEAGAMHDIKEYIKEHSYRTTGNKPDAEHIGSEVVPYRCFSKDGDEVEKNKGVFCIAPIPVKKAAYPEGVEVTDELPEMIYFRVVVFYQLDLPIFQDLFNFRVVGDTKILYGGYQ